MSKRVLVCGGAGFIGAHMCEQLAAHGHDIVVFDSLEGGHRASVRWGALRVGDLRDPAALDEAFAGARFDAVMQFAGKIVVSESVLEPATYYDHNVTGMLNLLRAVVAHGAPPVVFSSSAAVYGIPRSTPVDETHPCAPINPYGRTKLIAEQMLADFRAAHGLRSVSLRYFNAAGASRTAPIGEAHAPETHLIPNVLRAFRERRAVDVFGNDYPTPDGSCVRDYIHVTDLCRAHAAALEHLWSGGDNVTCNLGSERGFSVLEVLAAAEAVCGGPIARRIVPRRDGDPPVLVASAQRAKAVLGWTPTDSELATILESAWRWERRR